VTKFLVLYRANQSAAEQMATATPEEQQAGMAEWMAWATKAGPAIVDLGSPLAPAAGTTVSGDSIGGFSILQAESAEALQTVLEGHPHTAHGGTIEVHEFLPIPGM
jgi:YCII-related domain